MVITITLLILFALFFLIRKHVGGTMLAIIAGLSVYEMFGTDFVEFLSRIFTGVSTDILSMCIYLALILFLPLVLYLRSGHGGLFGVLRIAEALVLAALLTSLCSSQIGVFFALDQTSIDILNFIESIKGYILLGGVLIAYFDILFYRENDY